MQEPVICFDGKTYEKSEIIKYLKNQNNQTLPDSGITIPEFWDETDLIINDAILHEIQLLNS